jgi:hypothetical protein
MNINSRSWFANVILLSSFALPACFSGASGDPLGKQRGAVQSSGLVCVADADCLTGEECDDHLCKLHGGGDDSSTGAGGDDSSTSSGGDDSSTSSGAACVSDAECAVGEECDDGACKPHGKK